MINKQALPKPPRLLDPHAAGAYDWKEFDRFLQKLTALLGASSSPVNLFQGYLDNLTFINTPAIQQSTIVSTSTPQDASDLNTIGMAFSSTPANVSTVDSDDSRLTLYWAGV